MKIDKLRGKNYKYIKIELISLLREQFNLRMQKVSGNFKKPHLLRLVRRNIARVKMILKEKEIQKHD
ncbi:50S ribosomal protein L29 [Buchnera aphidicola (Hormaphis cornu)]|nr:50S ribosomal protein L29 [Buchnera aphidicola (Hormaphis cornu)]